MARLMPAACFQPHGAQVAGRADGAHGEVQAGRAAPWPRRPALFRSADAHLVADGDRQRRLRHQADGHEVGLHLVGHRLHRHRRGDEGAGVEQQRVAVGRGLGHRVAADHAVAAGLVVDDEGVAELLTQALRQHAAHLVQRAAGREGDDHAHGSCRARPVPGRCKGGGGRQEQAAARSPQRSGMGDFMAMSPRGWVSYALTPCSASSVFMRCTASSGCSIRPAASASLNSSAQVRQRTCALLAAHHHEVALVAVEPGHEHHAGLVEARGRLEDVARQRHRGRQDAVEARLDHPRPRAASAALAAGAMASKMPSSASLWRWLALRAHAVAGDQLGVVEVVAGVHAHARAAGGGAWSISLSLSSSEILMPSTLLRMCAAITPSAVSIAAGRRLPQ